MFSRVAKITPCVGPLMESFQTIEGISVVVCSVFSGGSTGLCYGEGTVVEKYKVVVGS